VDNDGDTLVDEAGELDPSADDTDGIDNNQDGSVDEAGETGTTYANPDWRDACPDPTLQDFVDGIVDKDGGELPEGVGAIEFQVKFDHKVFDLSIEESNDWTNGRLPNCNMTIISENDIRFGCVTVGIAEYDAMNNEDDGPAADCGDDIDNASDGATDMGDLDCWDDLGFPSASGEVGAVIHVMPEADLPFRIRPGKDNGVVRRLLDENCEVADIYGDIFPETNAGLTPDCSDVDITVRRLEGDVDMDCDVDVIDAQRMAFRYGAFMGQLLYDTFFDLEPFVTPDFDIDIKDLQFVFGRIGSGCQEPIPNSQEPQPANGVGQP
jgi:hypothetical protein